MEAERWEGGGEVEVLYNDTHAMHSLYLLV